jgi:hypothetical protein
MNPVNQFIEIAPDGTLKSAIIPQVRNSRRSIAGIEYDLLRAQPYHYTLEE